MHAQIVKRALLACFALLFVVAMAGAVQAGPLHFSVSKAQAGGVGVSIQSPLCQPLPLPRGAGETGDRLTA